MASESSQNSDEEKPAISAATNTDSVQHEENVNNNDEEEEEEEEEEPRLKFASLTTSQGPVYRNGDATSSFLVGGDKMVIGTHNGNIHVLSLPFFRAQRVYHAHSASVTAVSISPFPPPLPTVKADSSSWSFPDVGVPQIFGRNESLKADTASPKSPKVSQVPPVPSNSIYIGTSSIDGNVCVSSLLDSRDVILRNFGRPVQAVALSPNYKTDRTYLSGGLAGNLIVTVGGRLGTSSTSNLIGGAAAAASGWLGAIGLNSQNGHDTLLHSGEGSISTVKWSLSGNYVVWVNEQGIKIMRSHLNLAGAEAELSWKRISHMDRPPRPGWEEMASVWRAKAEWVNEEGLEADDDPLIFTNQEGLPEKISSLENGTPKRREEKRVEKLIVGWGGTIWVINVYSGNPASTKSLEHRCGHAELVTILRTDCIISGILFYTPSLLVVLAYVTSDESNDTSQSIPSKGLRRRHNALPPEMRIIDINSKEEICVADIEYVTRFGSLSATDYHLGVLPRARTPKKQVTQRGTLEAIGGGIWDAAAYPARLFSSAASVHSNGSTSQRQSSRAPSGIISDPNYPSGGGMDSAPHSAVFTDGMKIFIQSPYDCVLATKPTISDHLVWLVSREKYEEAWVLLETHPEATGESIGKSSGSTPSTPTGTSKASTMKNREGSLQDFFADDTSQATTTRSPNLNSQAEKEKRRIGDKWLQQLIDRDEWVKAGETAGKVLKSSASWEYWIWVFAHAHKYDEIAYRIPDQQLRPPLPSTVYEVFLGHYISKDRMTIKEMLGRWPPELYDVGSITEALESRLRAGDLREDSVEGGETGRDWRILTDSLAQLYLANGRQRDALRCYIKLQDVDATMGLISEYHLLDAVSDDIPGLILLRVSKDQRKSAPLSELEQLTLEPIRLLVNEAQAGIVRPEMVVSQLKSKPGMLPYLYFYFRALWHGDADSHKAYAASQPVSATHLAATEGKSLVSDHADLAVSLFADYDRPLLMDFLKTSQSYTLSTASNICEKRQYIPELVYLLSKQGSTKKALFIIIENLGDASQAISFAKEQDDPELWNDLLDYSMNKPSFIRALLEEVGTSIDPIKLVRRIPEGLEVEGLKDSLARMVREYELQYSVSEGVARVLRGEVARGMESRRTGQRVGMKFEIHVGARAASKAGKGEAKGGRPKKVKAGHCGGCGEALHEYEKQSLVGFPCTHIFHLSCLLLYDKPPPSSSSPPDIPTYHPPSDARDHGIGAKIVHVRELRGRMGGGCPLPVHKETEEE